MAKRSSFYLPIPKGVAAAARDGLFLVVEGHAGRGLTRDAVSRAQVLAGRQGNGEISRTTLRMMRNWFRRHHVDRRPSWKARKTPGWVAWQIWGGNAGWRWAERAAPPSERWTLPAWARV